MKIRRPSSLARRVRVLNPLRGEVSSPLPPSALDPLHFSTAPLSNPFGGCPSSKQPLRQFFKIREKASHGGLPGSILPRFIFLSEGLLRARFDAPDGVSRSDASSNQPFRGRISNYWLSEGLFRASFGKAVKSLVRSLIFH